MNKVRCKKISSEIKKVVNDLILSEIKDPRVSKFLSITHVEVTNDLSYVTIYVSSYAPNENAEESVKGLNSAKGYIRRRIGEEVRLRHVPQPVFKEDVSVEHAMHINDVISDIKRTEKKDEE